MLLNFKVQIGCVDGENHIEISSPRASDVLDCLKTHDHEGSTLSLVVTVNSNPGVYDVLQRLIKLKDVQW